MLKILGGVVVGVFFGAMMLEIVRRQKPELVEAVENKAKAVTDRIFDNMRDAYDFSETEESPILSNGA